MTGERGTFRFVALVCDDEGPCWIDCADTRNGGMRSFSPERVRRAPQRKQVSA